VDKDAEKSNKDKCYSAKAEVKGFPKTTGRVKVLKKQTLFQADQ